MSLAERHDKLLRLDSELMNEGLADIPAFCSRPPVTANGGLLVEVPEGFDCYDVQRYFDLVTGLKPQLSDTDIRRVLEVNNFYMGNRTGELYFYPTKLAAYLKTTDYIYQHPSDAYYSIYLSAHPEFYDTVIRDLSLKFRGSDKMPIYPLTSEMLDNHQVLAKRNSLLYKGQQTIKNFEWRRASSLKLDYNTESNRAKKYSSMSFVDSERLAIPEFFQRLLRPDRGLVVVWLTTLVTDQLTTTISL